VLKNRLPNSSYLPVSLSGSKRANSIRFRLKLLKPVAPEMAARAFFRLKVYFVSARGVGGGIWLMVHTRIFQASPSRTKIADQ
jgi:hypothetical protein